MNQPVVYPSSVPVTYLVNEDDVQAQKVSSRKAFQRQVNLAVFLVILSAGLQIFNIVGTVLWAGAQFQYFGEVVDAVRFLRDQGGWGLI